MNARNVFFAAISAATVTTTAAVAQDAASGEKVFRKCQACHAVGDDAKNKVGPALNGIVGRAAATVEGFAYSDAMKAKAAEGLVWDEANLTAYLQAPKDFIPGNKMAFAGLRKANEPADLIAYLSQFDD